MSAPSLPTRFDSAQIEARWQEFWEERRYFRAPEHPTRDTYTIPHPPPNVTGILTIGHAMGDTVRDVFARWHRMRGFDTLWFPGVDHAGLATQIEVRRRLAKSNIRLEDLSREEIFARVEEWRSDHERIIRSQIRAGGFSVDWSRYRYTMDPGFVRATREAFVRLHRDGLIYRGERFVNWDPELLTAVSDLEVVHSEEPGELWYIRYPWSDGSPGGIVIATVRPETIFGDIAVAVHPSDERHRSSVGRTVRVPLTDRIVPIITDDKVDPDFGNGALKLTPRHDLLDHEIFRRHPELTMPPTILDPSAHLVGDWVPADLRGLTREKARAPIVDALRSGGFLDRTEAIRHAVARSERTHAVIEPMLSTQWFVRMRPLAGPVLAAFQRGEIRIHPDRWDLTFLRWMESIEDWCISRQIVWGHPIPVHYCDRCHHEIVSLETPTACPECGSLELTGDPDVLDTWFSSWLWPFAGLGWPEATADLAGYYPTNVLVTGRDIMFFWVARMFMAGFYFTGRAPFPDVYFTGMLRDEEGRRMSKHLGNSPDPSVLIRERGADTLRFSLLYPNPVDQDAPFGAATLDQARNFLTKIWNLGRFTLGHMPEGTDPPLAPPSLDPNAPLEDRWILSRWRRTAEALDVALEQFEPTTAASVLWGFLWHDLADRYVEISKEALSGTKGEAAQRRTRTILLFVLERSLRQLHPMIPHVTEELWHALPHEGEALTIASWPRPTEVEIDARAESDMATVLEAIRLLRNLKAENRVPAQILPPAWVIPSGPAEGGLLLEQSETIRRLARLRTFEVLPPGASRPAATASAVAPAGEFLVELSVEGPGTDTLARERAKLQALLEKTQAQLADEHFRSHAPEAVVRGAEAKAEELAGRIRRIEANLSENVSGATGP
jgi:valyl-tRNA synthetase